MSDADFDALTLNLLRDINDRCNRFEAVLRAGGRPKIEDFLSGLDPDAREAVLDELQAIDAEYLSALRDRNGSEPDATSANNWHNVGAWATITPSIPRAITPRATPGPLSDPIPRPRMSSHLSQLLDAAAVGDRLAADAVMPLVYDELRTLAAARMAAEPAGHSLNATALVHEAYLRLVGPTDEKRWQNRGHFFAAAAEAMRRILIESARRKGRQKRGGDRRRVVLPLAAPAPELSPDDLLDLDEALTALAGEDPAKAELVKLRSFGGLSVEEAAACLGISRATADRYWTYARAWLYERLRNAVEPA